MKLFALILYCEALKISVKITKKLAATLQLSFSSFFRECELFSRKTQNKGSPALTRSSLAVMFFDVRALYKEDRNDLPPSTMRHFLKRVPEFVLPTHFPCVRVRFLGNKKEILRHSRICSEIESCKF